MNSNLGEYWFHNLDESHEDYDYVGYVNRHQKYIISRYTKSGTEGRYYYSSIDYSLDWNNRINLAYGIIRCN
jgi:hypothetical protein